MATTGLRQRVKKLVQNLPYLRNLYQYSTDLTEENRQLKIEREQLKADLGKLQKDCQRLREDRQELSDAGHVLGARFDEFRRENEKLNWLVNQTGKKKEQLASLWVVPGHFYSPIPNLAEIDSYNEALPWQKPEAVLGVDLRETAQIALAEKFKQFYSEIPFDKEPKEGLRYFFNNPNYSYSDGIILYSMLRHLKPRRIIEVGSGFSSQLILDTNELFFDGNISCTFIEPYPELLLSLLKDTNRKQISIIPSRIQDVDFGVFEELEADDILFIDSTHVSKFNSDVNLLFFEILPRLKPGVHIHFHDIVYPFEYGLAWLKENRAWNEAYILRAFLQYNRAFEIEFFSTFMYTFYHDWFQENMPLCLCNPGGNIWLKKK